MGRTFTYVSGTITNTTKAWRHYEVELQSSTGQQSTASAGDVGPGETGDWFAGPFDGTVTTSVWRVWGGFVVPTPFEVPNRAVITQQVFNPQTGTTDIKGSVTNLGKTAAGF